MPANTQADGGIRYGTPLKGRFFKSGDGWSVEFARQEIRAASAGARFLTTALCDGLINRAFALGFYIFGHRHRLSL
jgi:hypothetical protein